MIGKQRILLPAPYRRPHLLPAFLFAVVAILIATSSAQAAKCGDTYADPQKQWLVAYGCSSDYARDLAREGAFAREFVEWRAGQVSRPALVLDIDETSLSNMRQMLANDLRFIPTGPCRIDRGGPCSERAWELRAQGKPIQSTLAAFNAAKARGVAVFFITGRNDERDIRAATVRNLHRAGYRGWTALIMRAPGERPLSAKDFKTRHRARIAARGYTIIASVGDQWSDLDGGYVERKFKLPNPFYFIP